MPMTMRLPRIGLPGHCSPPRARIPSNQRRREAVMAAPEFWRRRGNPMMNLSLIAMYVRNLLGVTEDEEGQGLVEYGLIIVLVSIVVIAALTTVGGTLNNVFNQIAGNL